MVSLERLKYSPTGISVFIIHFNSILKAIKFGMSDKGKKKILTVPHEKSKQSKNISVM